MAATKKTTAKPKVEEAPVNPEPVEEVVPEEAAQPPQEPVEVQQAAPQVEPVPEPVSVYGSPYGRRVQAKAVFYTDGISGDADQNHERAYEYAERLQSNDPAERAAGDVSLSEAAQELRSEADKKEAEDVSSGSRS